MTVKLINPILPKWKYQICMSYLWAGFTFCRKNGNLMSDFDPYNINIPLDSGIGPNSIHNSCRSQLFSVFVIYSFSVLINGLEDFKGTAVYCYVMIYSWNCILFIPFFTTKTCQVYFFLNSVTVPTLLSHKFWQNGPQVRFHFQPTHGCQSTPLQRRKTLLCNAEDDCWVQLLPPRLTHSFPFSLYLFRWMWR